MKQRQLVPLCSLTALLTISCTSEETRASQSIIRNMYSQLACAASTVDPSVEISHVSPNYYAHPSEVEESYSLKGVFEDNNDPWNFYLTASKETEELKTRFRDDLSAVVVAHSFSNLSGDEIEITEEQVWSSALKDYLPLAPINKQEWEERYKKFLPQIYEKVKTVCEENPFAPEHEIENFQDYDAAIAKTTKPTLVYFHADWCGPCESFESGRLSDFMRENIASVDLVKVNVGIGTFLSIKPEWKELLYTKYKVNEHVLPTVVFLGKDHSYKGNHVGNDSQFESDAKIILEK